MVIERVRGVSVVTQISTKWRVVNGEWVCVGSFCLEMCLSRVRYRYVRSVSIIQLKNRWRVPNIESTGGARQICKILSTSWFKIARRQPLAARCWPCPSKDDIVTSLVHDWYIQFVHVQRKQLFYYYFKGWSYIKPAYLTSIITQRKSLRRLPNDKVADV